jgi:hypothetical protein
MDNIKMDLKREGMGVTWTDLDQDRNQYRALVNRVTSFHVP